MRTLTLLITVLLLVGCGGENAPPPTVASDKVNLCENVPFLGSYFNSYLQETLTFTADCRLTSTDCGEYEYSFADTLDEWTEVTITRKVGTGGAENFRGESCMPEGVAVTARYFYAQPNWDWVWWDWDTSDSIGYRSYDLED